MSEALHDADDLAESPKAARILPLWRAFLSEMREADRLKFGEFFTTAELAKSLCCPEESTEFAFAVARIRRALRRDGKNFTARGQQGLGFVIAAPETNHAEMQRLQSVAMTAMREGVILGTNTPIDLLSAEDRRKHEAVLEKMATRMALINRRGLPPAARAFIKDGSDA